MLPPDSHSEYADDTDRQTDKRTDAASVIKTEKIGAENLSEE